MTSHTIECFAYYRSPLEEFSGDEVRPCYGCSSANHVEEVTYIVAEVYLCPITLKPIVSV